MHAASAERGRMNAEGDYAGWLAVAGFRRIAVEPTRVYDVDAARRFLAGQGIDADAVAPLVKGKFMSAFIRAEKPFAAPGAAG